MSLHCPLQPIYQTAYTCIENNHYTQNEQLYAVSCQVFEYHTYYVVTVATVEAYPESQLYITLEFLVY